MPKHNRNGEGGVTRHVSGKWRARYTVDGKTKYLYAASYEEARQKLNQAINDRDKGLPVVPGRQAVGDYLASWLEATRPPKIEQSTWERREEYVRLHIKPVIGSIRLAKLSPQDIQRLYADRLAAGLSQTTVHHIAATIHNALKSALRLGLVQRNVSELVDAPRVARKEMTVWTPEQARTFLATTESNRLHALYVLALSTGMRQGELLGLRWVDTDLDRGIVSVKGNLQRPRAGLKLNSKPKTRTSRRRIALTDHTVACLREHRKCQREERLQLGEFWIDQGLVFANQQGGPYRSNNLEHGNFKPLIRKAGVPEIRFHDLRHTCATTLLLEGVNPKIVSEMLGHASVAITLDLYSHVLPDMQATAVSAISRALFAHVGMDVGIGG
jgi:integrase